MKFRFILMLAMAVVFLSTSAMAGGSPKGKPFIEIQGQFVEVENSVFDLEAEVASLTTRVDSVEDNIFNLENAVINLENENVILGEQIDSLINTAAVNSADIQVNLDLIESNQEQLTILRQDVVSNEFAIHDLEHEQEALYDMVVANVEGILSLQSQIDQNIEVMVELQNQIDDANAALALKADFMSASCPSGQALLSVDTETGAYTCATDLATDLALTALSQEIAVQIGNASADIASLSSSVANSQLAIATNGGLISGLRSDITTLNRQIAGLGADQEAQRANLQLQIVEKQEQLNGLFDATNDLQGQIDTANNTIADLQQQINDGVASSSSYGLRVAKVNASHEFPAATTRYNTYSHKHSTFGSYHTHSTSYTAPGGGQADAICPDGSLIQGGGISNASGVTTSDYQSDNGWRITGQNWYFSPRTVYFYASCLEVYEK